MYNNIAFRIFFAVLVIFSTARAADDLDFEALSNPRNKMRALKRAEALFSLSEKRTDLAEQCLDEIMLIAKGKYGLAKKRSASFEERTVVGKAIAALKRLCPAKANPFEKQETVGEVDATITRHLTALKAGFDHIAELMSAAETTQVEVFGVSFELSKPTIIPAEPIKLLKMEHDGDADEGVIIDEALESSAGPHSNLIVSYPAMPQMEERAKKMSLEL